MATEAQPFEVPPEYEFTELEEEPTRGDRIKAAAKEQYGHAKARGGDWLATRDLDEADLHAEVLKRRADKKAQQEVDLQRHVARLHARFDSEKRLAEAVPERDRTASIAHVSSELAAAETRLQHL